MKTKPQNRSEHKAVLLRVSPRLDASIQDAAKRAEMSVSAWIRQACGKAILSEARDRVDAAKKPKRGQR